MGLAHEHTSECFYLATVRSWLRRRRESWIYKTYAKTLNATHVQKVGNGQTLMLHVRTLPPMLFSQRMAKCHMPVQNIQSYRRIMSRASIPRRHYIVQLNHFAYTCYIGTAALGKVSFSAKENNEKRLEEAAVDVEIVRSRALWQESFSVQKHYENHCKYSCTLFRKREKLLCVCGYRNSDESLYFDLSFIPTQYNLF